MSKAFYKWDEATKQLKQIPSEGITEWEDLDYAYMSPGKVYLGEEGRSYHYSDPTK
jgi:hypothetical protein